MLSDDRDAPTNETQPTEAEIEVQRLMVRLDECQQALERLGHAVLALEALDARPENPDDKLLAEHIVAYANVRALARKIAREAME